MSKPKLLGCKSSLRDRFYRGFSIMIFCEVLAAGAVVGFFIFLLCKLLSNIRNGWKNFGQDDILFGIIMSMVLVGLFVVSTIYMKRYIRDRQLLESNACPKMRGEFIQFEQDETSETGSIQMKTRAIVRDLDTGDVLCLNVDEEDALYPGICYEFLYLPYTRHAYTVCALDEIYEEDAADTPPESEDDISQVPYTDTVEKIDTEAKEADVRKRFLIGFALTAALDGAAIVCLIVIVLLVWVFGRLPADGDGFLPSLPRIAFALCLFIAGELTISLMLYMLDRKKLDSGSFSTVCGQFVGYKLCWSLESGVGVITRRAFVECPMINGEEFRLAVSGEKLIPGAFYEFRYLPNTEIAYMVRRL